MGFAHGYFNSLTPRLQNLLQLLVVLPALRTLRLTLQRRSLRHFFGGGSFACRSSSAVISLRHTPNRNFVAAALEFVLFTSIPPGGPVLRARHQFAQGRSPLRHVSVLRHA